jgi:hypothetical protein
MKHPSTQISALFALGFSLIGSQAVCAQEQRTVVFHVRHVEENALYIDIGRNSGLQEGMKLALFHSSPAPSPSSGGPSNPGKPIAQLNATIVADSSAVCEIVNSFGEIKIGDFGFLFLSGKLDPGKTDGSTHGADLPLSKSASGDAPLDSSMQQKFQASNSLPQRNTAVRIGVDYDRTQVAGGFRASEFGFQVQSDMTHIAGSNWSFTGYWRSRFRQTFSGLNGAQLESLDDRIDRTYHIGLYYESPTSPYIAGFGRLGVPGAPSLPTVDGGYFGRKLSRHITLGAFGGSTPDPTAWDYNPNQRIAGIFTNLEAGDFKGLHLSGAEGIAMTAIGWRTARQFAFFENTLSWKNFLWFNNVTEVDAARTSPVVNRSNPTGISFTSSSIHVQPFRRLSVGLDHSYLNILPSFDPNLLGTSLLDKYIFQGLSVDARYELPYDVSLFTQVGHEKSIADTKTMWNSMYGATIGDLLKTGLRADVRYAKFASSFGTGNYKAVSVSRGVGNMQVEMLAGTQNLVSNFTSNMSSHFVTISTMWNLGPKYFIGTGFTWSRGTTLNYEQWNTMFGYRFGSLRK